MPLLKETAGQNQVKLLLMFNYTLNTVPQKVRVNKSNFEKTLLMVALEREMEI